MINPSLAMYPGLSVEEALGFTEGATQVQICPQTRGKLTKEYAEELVQKYPSIQFRLHANCKVEGWSSLIDLSNITHHWGYYETLAEVSKALKAEAYTLHAGLRRNCSIEDLPDHLSRLSDLFECKVGVEGMYTTYNDRYLLSTWDEYKRLLDLDVPYAIDLSHLNIVACNEGVEKEVVKSLLQACNCIEVHISGNDGVKDIHCKTTGNEWWQGLLNTEAMIFSEERMR